MKRTRQAIALALVATALCADRVVAAAPRPQPQAVSIAGRLVERLSGSLRRTVPAVRLVQVRRDGLACTVQAAPINPAVCSIYSAPLSPFQFRLPPPAV